MGRTPRPRLRWSLDGDGDDWMISVEDEGALWLDADTGRWGDVRCSEVPRKIQASVRETVRRARQMGRSPRGR